MKIKPEHYLHMQKKITQFVADNQQECQQHKDSHTPARYAWDICRAAGLTPFICDTLYDYLDDTHIQTALLRIAAGWSL